MKFRRMVPYLLVIAVAVAVFAGYCWWRSTITDTQAPTITIADGILAVSVKDPKEVFLQGVSAHDDIDGDVTGSVLVEKIGSVNENSEVSVTYCAFDKAGNVSKVRRTVRYTDYNSPRFYLHEPLLYAYGQDIDIVNRVGAIDCIDGDISHKIKPTLVSELPVSSEGIHQIFFRVTNSHGDTSVLQMPAEVYPTGKYNALLSLKEYLIYLPVGSTFDAVAYLDKFAYSDVTVSLADSLPDDYRLALDGKVDTSKAGVYPVSYTVTFSGNGYLCTAYSKLIVIVEG